MEVEQQPRFEIVQPTTADADALAAMHAASWNQAYPSDEHGISRKWVAQRAAKMTTKEGVETRREIIQESIDDPDFYMRVAKNLEGEIIGFSAARYREAEVEALYIGSSMYGSGLAAELITEAIQWIGEDRDITLTVASHNARAIRFYEKHGFAVIPETDRAYKDTPMRVVDMKRKGEAI